MQQAISARIAALVIYPVKGLAGIAVDKAQLTPQGLAGDREWMLVDANGRFLSQRELPLLAQIVPQWHGQQLCVSWQDTEPMCLEVDADAPLRSVVVWGDECLARPARKVVNQWFAHILQRDDVELVRFERSQPRRVDEKYNAIGADTYFADGFPFLLVSMASLAALNQALLADDAQPVNINRFRGNIVLEDLPGPWLEDLAQELITEDAHFALVKPCKRCPVITVEQSSGTVPAKQQPLRTLTAIDHVPGKRGPYFGQNMLLLAGTQIAVGENVLIRGEKLADVNFADIR